MELIILLMLGVLSTSAPVENQDSYAPDVWGEITEARQAKKLTNPWKEAMEGRGRQWKKHALELKTADREGKRLVPCR